MGKWDYLKPWEDKVRSALSDGNVQCAMDALVQGYQHVVVGYCVKMLGDPTQGADVAQEVFMAVYRALPRFRWDSSLLTFVLKIARRRCLTHIKRDGTRKTRFDQKRDEIVENTQRGGQDPLEDDPLLRVLDIEQDKLDKKQLERLSDSLKKLKKRQRDLIMMRYYEGLSLVDIAKRLWVGETTVRRRLHEAQADLKKYMGI